MSEAQTYRERPPAHGLARHLSCGWVQHVGSDAEPYEHRTVPNGGVEIVHKLGSAPRVVGPQTGPTVEILEPGATVVGVRFRPGAAPPALGLPMSELVDLDVEAVELMGDAAKRLGEAASADEAARLLEHELVARVGDGEAPDPIVAETVHQLMTGGAEQVGSLPSSLYISERQLRRRCLVAIGLAPKPLHRMLRFQSFLALAHARGLAGAGLAELAARAGYADQSHLTRESMRLAGVSPRTLLREAERHCQGVHDHRASYAPLLKARAAAA